MQGNNVKWAGVSEPESGRSTGDRVQHISSETYIYKLDSHVTSRDVT